MDAEVRPENLTLKVKFLYKFIWKFDLFCQISFAAPTEIWNFLSNFGGAAPSKRSSLARGQTQLLPHTSAQLHRSSQLQLPARAQLPDAAPFAAPYGVKIWHGAAANGERMFGTYVRIHVYKRLFGVSQD